jgi:hypothetical protein
MRSSVVSPPRYAGRTKNDERPFRVDVDERPELAKRFKDHPKTGNE